MVDFGRLSAPLAAALHGDAVSVWKTVTVVTDRGDRVQGDPVEVTPSLACDIQPYSAELSQKEYGLTMEVQYRLYTLGKLELGQLIQYEGGWYRVVGLPERGAVTAALLQSCRIRG